MDEQERRLVGAFSRAVDELEAIEWEIQCAYETLPPAEYTNLWRELTAVCARLLMTKAAMQAYRMAPYGSRQPVIDNADQLR